MRLLRLSTRLQNLPSTTWKAFFAVPNRIRLHILYDQPMRVGRYCHTELEAELSRENNTPPLGFARAKSVMCCYHVSQKVRHSGPAKSLLGSSLVWKAIEYLDKSVLFAQPANWNAMKGAVGRQGQVRTGSRKGHDQSPRSWYFSPKPNHLESCCKYSSAAEFDVARI